MTAELAMVSHGQIPDVTIASTDIISGGSSILQLTKQLDSFSGKDLFLGKFRMLGRNERRQGGVQPC
jgi:hypothetical protein